MACVRALWAMLAAVSCVAALTEAASCPYQCSLNGRCLEGGVCECYAPWVGPSCGELAVQPLPAAPLGLGMRPNHTTWGGNVVEVDGKYHLFAASMVNDCPLATWGTNSECVHAVANDPMGPYAIRDVAVPRWCHNPQVVSFTDPVTGEAAWALFHIGTGTSSSPAKRCSGTTMQTADDGLRQEGRTTGGSELHIAHDTNGPWEPVTAPPSCNNPAPMLHPNGTWYIVCDSLRLMKATNVTGPWQTVVSSVQAPGGVPGVYEDAFLFMDARHNWHVIYHVYNATTPCGECSGAMVSGHTFSADGLQWSSSPVQPYVGTAVLADGGVKTFATRERPKLLFDAAGTPTHLFNGACGGTATCPPTPGVNCKYGYWDFTLVQALATAGSN